jgi:putative transposase
MRHRRSRHEVGHAHELTFSCYRKFPFLKAERTCIWLAEAIEEARRKWSFSLWAYVFMPDHVHLLVKPEREDAQMSEILKAIKAPVARQAIAFLEQRAPDWLPRITRRRGCETERLFWQSGGGFDRNVTETGTLLAMIEYIHANPVRKMLVERPRDWRWSSAAWFDDFTAVPLTVDPLPKDWME